MKWYYRFIVVAILAAAIVGPYFIKKPDGKPIMELPTASDFMPDKLLTNTASSGDNNTASSYGQTYYKWQDDQGQWHYGDQPPTSSGKVSTLQVNPNTNIIQSLKIEPEIEEQPQQANQQQTLPSRLSNGEISFDNAVNVLNDATLVRDMMESRNEQLKALVGE